MSQGRTTTTAQFEKFLFHLREVPNVTRAARLCGLSPKSFRNHKKSNATFSEAWDDALEEAIETCELEVHRRAFEGTDKPITYMGNVTGTYKEYSDSLATFLLKAHRPERYRERTEIDMTVTMSVAERLVKARTRVAASTTPAEDDDLAG